MSAGRGGLAHVHGQCIGKLPCLVVGQEQYSGEEVATQLIKLSTLGYKCSVDERAYQALLDSTILPLVLHSLYSVPSNFQRIRSLLSRHMTWPANLYQAESSKLASERVVKAKYPGLWGLGGQLQAEEEDERRSKRILLASDWQDQQDEDARQRKKKVKLTFSHDKVGCRSPRILHQVFKTNLASDQLRDMIRTHFAAFDATLAQSTTGYFFSAAR